jgi:hypothetical protein
MACPIDIFANEITLEHVFGLDVNSVLILGFIHEYCFCCEQSDRIRRFWCRFPCVRRNNTFARSRTISFGTDGGVAAAWAEYVPTGYGD